MLMERNRNLFSHTQENRENIDNIGLKCNQTGLGIVSPGSEVVLVEDRDREGAV